MLGTLGASPMTVSIKTVGYIRTCVQTLSYVLTESRGLNVKGPYSPKLGKYKLLREGVCVKLGWEASLKTFLQGVIQVNFLGAKCY